MSWSLAVQLRYAGNLAASLVEESMDQIKRAVDELYLRDQSVPTKSYQIQHNASKRECLVQSSPCPSRLDETLLMEYNRLFRQVNTTIGHVRKVKLQYQYIHRDMKTKQATVHFLLQ